jgi:hypothetical protein
MKRRGVREKNCLHFKPRFKYKSRKIAAIDSIFETLESLVIHATKKDKKLMKMH